MGLVLLLVFYGRPAEANLLEDFWNSFIAPFRGGGAAPAAPAPSEQEIPSPRPEQEIPLYKPAIDYEKAVVAAVKKASPAVVSITVSKNVPIIEQCPYDPFADLPPEFRGFFGGGQQFYIPCERGTELREVGGGSGFIISEGGLILTNKHVVADTKASYTVFLNDGRKFDATVLARDPIQDLAVVKINATGLPTVELGDSDELELGQTAIAIGNALGEFRNTVSVGVISGLSRKVTAGGEGGFSETIYGVIQTDTAINPGNSGGPLLNLRGQVIGINTAIVSGAENIGFAIPINDAKRDIESVRSTGEIQLPFLGVRYAMTEKGALLQGADGQPAISPGSPAEAAGLKAGDIIVELGGEKIDKDHPLASVIAKHGVGETVNLKVLRGGEILDLQATLTKRPSD